LRHNDKKIRFIDMKRRWRELVPNGQMYQVSVALDERRMPIALHDHDFAEVLWVVEGEGLHRVNGRKQWLHSGHLVFIRPADRHALEAARPSGEKSRAKFRLENVAFSSGVLRDVARRYEELESGLCLPWLESGPLPATFLLESGQRDALAREVDLLRIAPRNRLALDRFLLNLFRLIEKENTHTVQLPDWLQRTLSRFRVPEDLAEGVSALQRLAGRCPEHLARSMRNWLRLSPTEWVNARRLDHAARLMEATDLTVTEVALRSGFGNLGHFHRSFRNRHGMSPLRHRREVHAIM
jgi:AraC family cel operon transcriptional repressor